MRKQKGLAPIYLLIGLVILVFILLVPIPYYFNGYCDIPCLSSGTCSCPQKGWYLGNTLWKSILTYFSSINRSSGQTIETTIPPIIPTPSSSIEPTTPAETANWKTYTNKKGYSIQYPVPYSLEESSDSSSLGGIVELGKDVTYRPGGYAGGSVIKTGSLISLSILRRDLSENGLRDGYGNDITIQKIILNNKDAIEIILPTQRKNRHIFYNFGDVVLDISLNIGFEVDAKQSQEYLSDFDQILSTFKFTQ